MLLEEFDPDPHAVIDPSMTLPPVKNMPTTVISIFSHQLFNKLVSLLNGTVVAQTSDVDGIWNVYEVTYNNHRFALYKARLGAPACVGCFEELIAFGVKRIILLGNCGVLRKEIQDCGIIIPDRALRDEGTSCHYAPIADSISVNHKYITVFQSMLRELGYPFVTGTTWTTDAFFRETPNKVAKRKSQGAICVEMECAAMQALCDFRNVEFFQFFYAGDNLDHSQWEPRSLAGSEKLDEKEKIALLAFEFACKIESLTIY